MSKVLVIELAAEDTDIEVVLLALAHGLRPPDTHVHVAIREDAAAVLAVFKRATEPQEAR